MVVVLDTNVLWDPRVIARLGREGAVLPAVAFAERARQILVAGRSLDELWALLEASRVTVEPHDEVRAVRTAQFRTPDAVWARLARDAFIAGHVGPGDVLWTKNPKDFLAVGLPPERILAC